MLMLRRCLPAWFQRGEQLVHRVGLWPLGWSPEPYQQCPARSQSRTLVGDAVLEKSVALVLYGFALYF